MPKRSFTTSRSRSGSWSSARMRASERRLTSTSSSGSGASLGSRSPNAVSPSSPIGRSRLVTGPRAARGVAQLLDVLDLDLGSFRDLLVARRAAQLGLKLALHACDLAFALADVHG